MKVLSASQMRAVDAATIEAGIPGIVLMENAAHRVLEVVERVASPISGQRVVVLCGKGNNGGDGLAIARQLHTRLRPESLAVVLLADPVDLKGDAALNHKMLEACGCLLRRSITPDLHDATLVIDALLGTGITGPARGDMLEGIRAINNGFPRAKVIAVDIPSGMPSDSPEPVGEFARADYTATFTSLKIAHALPPNCNHMGEITVGAIGSRPEFYDEITLSLVEPQQFAPLLRPRDPSGNKGTYGHVLVLAGSRGKTGAAAMSGIAALRAGAGLVTVASAQSALPTIAAHAAELMTEPLDETADGAISAPFDRVSNLLDKRNVLAMGPGLGTAPETAALVRRLYEESDTPTVVDADALNILAQNFPARAGALRILTPHPGEMSRLTGLSTRDVLKDRVSCAQSFAQKNQVTLILKGERTLLAFPDGRVWINPTGTPAMATGGTGDILTGLIAGLLAQFPDQADLAAAGAVYLHGLAGRLGATDLGEKALIATDILHYFPKALTSITPQ